MDKLQEQEMNQIKSIKQNVMGKKPKMIRDKLKDNIINDTFTFFETEEEKEDKKRKKTKE